jgi:hypothetical protein
MCIWEINKMDLMKFCVDEYDQRDNLRTPFNVANFLYATNGHFCLRIDKDLAYVNANEQYKDKLELMFEGVDSAKYVDLLLVPDNKLIDCKDCNGTGYEILEECSECDGMCEITFSNKHHEYTFDCKTCDGKGEVKTTQTEIKCSECCGERKIIDSKNNYYPLGDARSLVHISSLQVLKGIPDVKYAVLQDYVSFKIGTGYGVTSIVRKDDD